MNSQQMMEEIDRLARLCEAKDEEYNELDRHYADELADGRKLRAMIAMQAEALKALMEWQVKNVKVWHNSAYDHAHYVLSATAETIAAFQAKETEPLRREVAMLRDVVADALHELRYAGAPLEVLQKFCDALSKSQATALAYEREVENRGAVKALEELLDEADDSNWRNAAYSRVEELRASKGE